MLNGRHSATIGLRENSRNRENQLKNESSQSLTYLEWVHEKQTKRMLTRSEWFLTASGVSSAASPSVVVSGVRQSNMPQKNTDQSKSYDFPNVTTLSHVHLKLPKHVSFVKKKNKCLHY